MTLRALVSLLSDLEPELVGRSVAPVDRMRQLEMRFRLVGWQGLVGMAVGAIDMALWDALGRAAGRPVAALLGGELRPLPAYDSYGIIDPSKDAHLLERSVQSGFRAVKIKIGGGDLADDVEIVRETRRIIGPDVALMVDYNQSQTVTGAIERIRRLSEFDLAWVEEPVCADDLHGHRRVRTGVAPVPIQTGENWWFPRGMANSIAADASDLAMVDIMKIGGSPAGSTPWDKPTQRYCHCPAIPSPSPVRTPSRSRRPRTGSSTSTSPARFSRSGCSPTTAW